MVNLLWSLSQWMWYMYCMLKAAFCCQLHWNVSQSTDAENVFRADEGETVDLPCHSPPNNSEQVSVEWTKHSTSSTTICKFDINIIKGSLTEECVPRFTFNRKSFTLSIENIQLSDSGYYRCKTIRMIPPPSLDNTSNVTLQVAGECNSYFFKCLLLVGYSLDVSNKHHNISLRCSWSTSVSAETEQQ